MRSVWVLALGCGAACLAPACDTLGGRGSSDHQPSRTDGGPGFGEDIDAAALSSVCGNPTPAGPEVELAPAFAPHYRTFELGSVPGAPRGLLGGCVIPEDDPDTLYVAVNSEREDGAIYAVKVRRACGHIVGFDGEARLVAATPFVDANLVYGPDHVLFYSEWPENRLSQLLPGARSASRTTELAALGVAGGGPGGIGFVPPNLAAAGQLRAITWPDGHWMHLPYAKDGALFALTTAQRTTVLPNGPGGFAYVPDGSPGFTKQRLIVAEWSVDRVATYEVDAQGDPLPPTREEFFTRFPRPWGAYFEPVTGDYLFLTWGASKDAVTEADRVYVVQGFSRPPPAPTIPH